MDLLEALGLSPPADENALCFEIYKDTLLDGASEADLAALATQCSAVMQPHCAAYIWQHEPLTLHSSLQQRPPWQTKRPGKLRNLQQQQQPQGGQQGLPCLWGVLGYGDNVEDEWWAVWLLLEATRQLPGLAVRMWDDDGDFLLIEAAYSLPRWLKPETATNRVWLTAGQLHIIPPPSAAAPQLPAAPSIRQALEVLLGAAAGGGMRCTTHQPKVEAAVLARLSGYPARAGQQLQRVTAWLPQRVAALLQAEPQLVAAAVAAFMTRQREDVQAAARLSNFPPQEMTTALVCLNRCMYAQLMQADFSGPKAWPQAPPAAAAAAAVAGPAWLGGSSARQSKAIALGLKITTGMEIMALRMGISGVLQPLAPLTGKAAAAEQAAAAAAADTRAGTEQQQQQTREPKQQLPPLSANPAWHAYLRTLQQSGYFSGELPGSARHRQLTAAAEQAFRDSDAFLRSSEAVAAPARRLQQLLAGIDAAAAADVAAAPGSSSSSGRRDAHSQQQQQQQTRSPVAAVFPADDLSEDSDSWMMQEVARLQQQLEEQEEAAAEASARKQQRKQAAAGSSSAAAATGNGVAGAAPGQEVVVDAEQLVAGLKGFVQHMSGLEGAEVPAAAAASSGSGSSAKKRPLQAGSSSAGNCAAAAAGRPAAAGVVFDAEAVLQEMLGVLGASGLQAAAESAGGSGGSSRRSKGQAAAAAPKPEALLQQLQGLEQQLRQMLLHADGDSDDDNSDDSSSEGSSFYGSEDTADDGDDDDDGQEQAAGAAAAPATRRSGPEQLPVPPPVSGRQHQHQQQQQQPGWQLPPSFRGPQLQEAWEVMTATDSDDEEDGLSIGAGPGSSSDEGDDDSSDGSDGSDGAAGFRAAYSSALEAELAGTTMAESFVGADKAAAAAAAEQGAGSSSGAGGGGGGSLEGLAPLDLDMNLVRSLVASFTAQGGLPGPASNLAGLLGLQLPTEVVEEP